MVGDRAALLLDEDVWPGLAETLREQGFDAVSVHEIGRTGLADEEQMAFTVAETRVLITHNASDFVTIARTFYTLGHSHPGIIIAPHLEKGTLVRRVLTLLETTSTSNLTNTVRFV